MNNSQLRNINMILCGACGAFAADMIASGHFIISAFLIFAFALNLIAGVGYGEFIGNAVINTYHTIRRFFKPHIYWTQEEFDKASREAKNMKEFFNSNKCRDNNKSCVYSRSMNQEYPRRCIQCNEPEQVGDIPELSPLEVVQLEKDMEHRNPDYKNEQKQIEKNNV